MIIETIISSIDQKGKINFAPFGIKKIKNKIFISPYTPSKTLENLKDSKCAVVNYTNDSSFFVNCIIGEKKFKKSKCKRINGFFLEDSLSFDEVVVDKICPDKLRPTFICKIVNSQINRRFEGFNRAHSSIIEACILASRVKILKKERILKDMEFLNSAVEKTAGRKELNLWKTIENYIEGEFTK